MKSEFKYVVGMRAFKNTITDIHGTVSTQKTEPHTFDVYDVNAWLDGEKNDDPTNPERPRARAYLTAYVKLMSGYSIPAKGIRFADTGLLSLDKGVIAALLHHNLLNLEKPFLVVTESGQQLLESDSRTAGFLDF